MDPTLPMKQLSMDHPLRSSLANELHARPFLRLEGSVSVSHYAIYFEGDEHVHAALLRELCQLTGLQEPDGNPTHYSGSWDDETQLKWERHTEFSTFTFVAQRHDENYFSDLSIEHVPQAWFESLEGKSFVANRLELISGKAATTLAADVRRWISGPVLVSSRVLGGGQVFCDWTTHIDGFSRFLVLDHDFREQQGGRLLQRLYEIETYRMMALLALPMARQLGRTLDDMHSALSPLMQRMEFSTSLTDDASILGSLTHFAARIESNGVSASRFSASRAYERLVGARIQELREERIEGFPTISEFMERRFAPAMETCRAVCSRQEQFAERLARAVDLLRTRVSLAQERDTTRLLEGMNQTARSQLKLQHAVEGLSVAAISYYVLALTGVALKAMHAVRVPVDPELVEGLLIVPVVVAVSLITRRTTRGERKRKRQGLPKAMPG